MIEGIPAIGKKKEYTGGMSYAQNENQQISCKAF
jgi:hypothetical protein